MRVSGATDNGFPVEQSSLPGEFEVHGYRAASMSAGVERGDDPRRGTIPAGAIPEGWHEWAPVTMFAVKVSAPRLSGRASHVRADGWPHEGWRCCRTHR